MYDGPMTPTKLEDYNVMPPACAKTVQDNIEETRRVLIEARALLNRITGFIWLKDVNNKQPPDENMLNVVDMDSAIMNNLEMARFIANSLDGIACKLGA